MRVPYSGMYVFSMMNRGVTPETAARYLSTLDRCERWFETATPSAFIVAVGFAMLLAAFVTSPWLPLVGAALVFVWLVDHRRRQWKREFQVALAFLEAELHERWKPTAQQVVEDLRRD